MRGVERSDMAYNTGVLGIEKGEGGVEKPRNRARGARAFISSPLADSSNDRKRASQYKRLTGRA